MLPIGQNDIMTHKNTSLTVKEFYYIFSGYRCYHQAVYYVVQDSFPCLKNKSIHLGGGAALMS